MSYSLFHYYQYGDRSQCVSFYGWQPGPGPGKREDGYDSLRDQITYAYYSLFGRYGEEAGVEGYIDTWVNRDGQGLYGSIEEMVRYGGDNTVGGSGEWNFVQAFGKHTDQSSGFCPVVEEPPPPPPPKRPYVKINGVWIQSRNVYVKDAGSWKLCRSAYVKDGGVWKPFLEN